MENKKKWNVRRFKKFLPVLMAFALIVSPLLGISKAFAATTFGTNGFLYGKSAVVTTDFSNLTSSGVSTPNATDNNNTTSYSLSANNGLLVDLGSGGYTISSFNVDFDSYASSTWEFYLYDSNKTLLASPTLGTLNGNTFNLSSSVSNVRYVVLKNIAGASHVVYDFDAYGTISVTHDEISGLTSTVSGQNVTLNYTVPTSNSAFTGSKIYRDGSLIATEGTSVTTYTDSGLAYSSSHTYKVTATYSDGNETTGQTATAIIGADPSSLPPNPVSGLNVTNITAIGATLNWTPSSSSTVTGYNIYVNGSLVHSLTDPTANTYVVSGLTSQTTYSLAVTSVTSEQVESSQSTVSVTTLSTPDTTAPNVVSGVKVNVMDSALGVSWNANTESDLAGYNVYVDGSLVNTGGLIKNTDYTIPNLNDGQSYNVQVSAVDTSGNESVLSTAVSGTPKASAVPIIKTKYSLQDVADGVANWFSSYWLIIAFASAIPLSFYIASRIKLMFLD